MMKYICELCGTIYDEDVGDVRSGIQPGTKFSELPEDYACPGCYYLKEAYYPLRSQTKAEEDQER